MKKLIPLSFVQLCQTSCHRVFCESNWEICELLFEAGGLCRGLQADGSGGNANR